MLQTGGIEKTYMLLGSHISVYQFGSVPSVSSACVLTAAKKIHGVEDTPTDET